MTCSATASPDTDSSNANLPLTLIIFLPKYNMLRHMEHLKHYFINTNLAATKIALSISHPVCFNKCLLLGSCSSCASCCSSSSSMFLTCLPISDSSLVGFVLSSYMFCSVLFCFVLFCFVTYCDCIYVSSLQDHLAPAYPWGSWTLCNCNGLLYIIYFVVFLSDLSSL